MNKPSHEYCKECNDWNGNISKCMEICSIPIDIIKEWEQYRTIGTVEECREAVEKMKPKKTVSEIVETRKCPICGSHDIFTYCGKCGQKMEW